MSTQPDIYDAIIAELHDRLARVNAAINALESLAQFREQHPEQLPDRPEGAS